MSLRSLASLVQVALLAVPVVALAGAPLPLPSCWPAQMGGAGNAASYGTSSHGVWMWWDCPDGKRIHLLNDWGLSYQALGKNFDSIRNSGNPVKTAAALWNQLVTEPSNESPRFDLVYADMLADMKTRTGRAP